MVIFLTVKGSNPKLMHLYRSMFTKKLPGICYGYRVFFVYWLVFALKSCDISKGCFLFPFVFPLCVYRLYELLQLISTFSLHFFGDMAIHVQSEGRCGVAQVLLHRLYIVAGSDGGNRIGVPQIVESSFRAADLLHDLLEGFIHGGG